MLFKLFLQAIDSPSIRTILFYWHQYWFPYVSLSPIVNSLDTAKKKYTSGFSPMNPNVWLVKLIKFPTGCSTEVIEVLPAAAAALSRVENQVPRGVALSKSWSLNQQRKEFNSIVTIRDGKCPKMSLKFSYITQLSSIGDMSSETQIRFSMFKNSKTRQI